MVIKWHMHTSLIWLSIFIFGSLLNAHSQTCQDKRHVHCSHQKLGALHNSNAKSSTIDNLRSDTLDIKNYSIFIDFSQANSQQISGSCEILFTAKQNNVSSISLDLLKMNIDSIIQQSQSLSYSYNDTLLIVTLNQSLNTGDLDSITVYYNGSPQGDPSNWGGFYFQGNYSYNLGVGFEADPHNYGRVWHPCFDNFVERATYSITLKTPNGLKGFANGLLTNSTNTGTHLINEWHLSQEIPTYLACIASAPYTQVNQTYLSTLFSNTIPVMLVAEPNDTSNLKSSFINLFGAIESFEQNYGPYMWDKVGYHLVPFSSGAMEHATQIAYPKATATGGLTYETLMAHELAHSWWGNLVTCRTEGDMWINEGMASYSERIFLEHVYGYTSYINSIKANHKDVLLNAHIRDQGYYAIHGVPHAITYGDHSYNKGADVAHTLRGYMGDQEFFDGLQSFLAANHFKDVDAYNFRDHINANTGVDVTDFFNDWVFNPGFPAFYIDSITSTASGNGIFDVKIYVKQKLKGTTQYFSNVPMEITFMKDDWTSQTHTFDCSNSNTILQITLPFIPSFAYFNGADKISQAVTGENVQINSPVTKDLTYPMFRFTTSSITDSALVRIEHYWVSPDAPKNSETEWMYHISKERFWKVDGFFPANFQSDARIFFNGKTTVGANLDNELTSLTGFHEDSLYVFHRLNCADDWQIVMGATMQSLGSKTDGYGYFTLDTLKKGEYTFGWKKSTLSYESTQSNTQIFNVYPNPSTTSITIDLIENIHPDINYKVFDMSGKLLMNGVLSSTKTLLDMENLPKGMYILQLTNVTEYFGHKSFIKN
jgi:aminopeptidase N